jgi:hypothetical protein
MFTRDEIRKLLHQLEEPEESTGSDAWDELEAGRRSILWYRVVCLVQQQIDDSFKGGPGEYELVIWHGILHRNSDGLIRILEEDKDSLPADGRCLSSADIVEIANNKKLNKGRRHERLKVLFSRFLQRTM